MTENWPIPPSDQTASGQPPFDAVGTAPLPGRRRRAGWWLTGGALVVAASMGGGVALGATVVDKSPATSSPQVQPSSTGGQGAANEAPDGLFPGGGGGSGTPGFGQSGGSAAAAGAGSATAAQEKGIVDIDTVLGYQGGEAAGTGMILTSSGEVLTNNHVVDGATSIKVTVVSTGKSYTATVVGTDPTQDVAVLQLRGASGLQLVKTDSAITVGESVTGVGNAGGTGGTPSAAAGTVTDTDQTIAASDENGANPETLHGVIQDDADIQAGDSGGPLLNSSNQVVGMDTAAADTPGGATGTAFAIPIDTALQVADQIESGQASSTIQLGYPAFLGVSLLPSELGVNGVPVQGVLSGTPAAQVGITGGDVITAVGGQPVGSADALQAALSGLRPGQKVTVTWTDQMGQSHTATVTLAQGPAN